MIYRLIGWESLGQMAIDAAGPVVVAVLGGVILGVITQGLISWRRLGVLASEVASMRASLDERHHSGQRRLDAVERRQDEQGQRLDDHGQQLAELRGRLGSLDGRVGPV